MKLLTAILAIMVTTATALAAPAPEQGIKCGDNGVSCLPEPNKGVKIGEHCGGISGNKNRKNLNM